MLRSLAATAVLVLCACPKKEAPVPAPPPVPATPKPKLPTPSTDAEVELIGTWSMGAVKAASVALVAQLEPCLPPPVKPTRLGEERLGQPGRLFVEFFIKQGTVGHACLYAKDEAGALVGAAPFPGNPLTFEGPGEVVFKADVVLAPLAP